MQGSYWMWIIIVVLILLGGWWYFTQTPAPATENTEAGSDTTPLVAATGDIDTSVDAIIASGSSDESAFNSESTAAAEASDNSSFNDVGNAYDPSNF